MGLIDVSATRLRSLLLQIPLVALVSSAALSSVTEQRRAASDLWPAPLSSAVGKSHLLMWIRTEKQLMPLVSSLAESVLDILLCQCKAAGYTDLTTECLQYAGDLTDSRPLPDFPSPAVLQAESRKHFAKVLMEDVVSAMGGLEHQITPFADYMKQCPLGDKLLPSLRLASRQFGTFVKSFYNSNVKDAKLSVSKKVSKEQDAFRLPIKALYNAYNRLKLINSVLEYYLDLSWFSRLEILSKGKKK